MYVAQHWERVLSDVLAKLSADYRAMLLNVKSFHHLEHRCLVGLTKASR